MENLEFLKNFKFNEEGRLIKGEKNKMTPEQRKQYERVYANMYYDKRVRKGDKPKKTYKKSERISLRPIEAPLVSRFPRSLEGMTVSQSV